MVRIKGRVLKLGDNVEHRLCRPAWTSEEKTGGLENSCNHRHGRDLQFGFYVKSKGQYGLSDPKMRTKRRIVGGRVK